MDKNTIVKYKEKRSFKKDIPLLPGYILMTFWVAFIVVALSWLIVASLSTTKSIFTNTMWQDGFSLEHYIDAFVRGNIGLYFINSIIYASSACVGIICIAGPAAYVLSRKVFPARKILTTLFVASIGVPAIMIVMPIYFHAAQLKLIGTTGSMFVVILLYIALNIPFGVFFLSAFFYTIPTAMEEAATIDGATPEQAFWKVILPLTQPAVVTLTIFNFIGVWNEYFIAVIFANTAQTRTVTLAMRAMVMGMQYSGNWAGLFAAICIVFIPTVFIYLFLSEKIIAGITGGAMKG